MQDDIEKPRVVRQTPRPTLLVNKLHRTSIASLTTEQPILGLSLQGQAAVKILLLGIQVANTGCN